MKYRVILTTQGNGRDETAARALLSELHRRYAHLGPVAEQNTEADTLGVTVALEAWDATAAIAAAADIIGDCFAHAGLQPPRIIGVEAELVTEHELLAT